MGTVRGEEALPVPQLGYKEEMGNLYQWQYIQ
jgi:hypothetical protein